MIRPFHRLRRPAVAVAGLALAGVLTACEPHTIDLGFEPTVGETFRFRSTIRTEVDRSVEGRSQDPVSEVSTLEATETVTDVDDAGVTMEVSIRRDGAPPREYTARFAQGQHLSAADLIEGTAADAVGMDLAADLPSDLSSPPSGPLEPGQRWTIEREVATGREPILVTGQGRVRTLAVHDGHDVALVEVELVVPIRSAIDHPNGLVLLEGHQISRSRTTYDLTEGTVRHDRTTVDGDVAWSLEPPPGVDAAPLPGTITYTISTNTHRVYDD